MSLTDWGSNFKKLTQKSLNALLWMSSQVGKDIELDAVDCEFEPYLTAKCVCILVAPIGMLFPDYCGY